MGVLDATVVEFVVDANAAFGLPFGYLFWRRCLESAIIAHALAHVVNLCEVFYDFHRAGGQENAISALKDLALAGVVESAEISTLYWQTVGTLKSIHKRVSLADCFLIALADQRGATVLTADHHEFDVQYVW